MIIINTFLLILFFAAGVLLARGIKKSLYRYSNLILLTSLLFLLSYFVTLAFAKLSAQANGAALSEADRLSLAADFPARFVSYALFAFMLVAVLLFISNISLIVHEGLRVRNILATAVAAVYVGASMFLPVLSQRLNIHRGITVFFFLLICYMECFLAATCVMGLLAAYQKPKYDKDYIIIPGCAISKKGGLLPLLKGRTNRAVRYAWEQEIASGRPVKYVPSGGQGVGEIMSEGSAMELYLLSHGAEKDEVFPERQSKNTYENFLFSKKIIEQQKPDASIAFATTNYHMLRCGLIAESLGMSAEGISSGTKWYFWPNGFVREYIAIIRMGLKKHIAAVAVCALLAAALALYG